MEESTPSQTILLATADEDAALPVTGALAAMGLHVVRAWDGEEALRQAVALTPLVLVVDRYLPVIHGLAVAAELRADPRIPAATPIVLLSSEPLDAREQEKAGVATVRAKNAPVHEWRELMGSLLVDHWRSM